MASSLLRPTLRGLAVATLSLAAVACSGNSEEAVPDNPGGVLISRSTDDGSYLGTELATSFVMPDVTLEDTAGKPFNLVTDTTLPITLVFFGYTNCPDICNLVMNDLTLALLKVPDDVREQTQLVFVTTDPARDTPDVLQAYLDRFDPSYIGLTGDIDVIKSAADQLGVAMEGQMELPSGGYDVSHGSQVIGFTHDQAPVVWTQGTAVDDVATDIAALAGP